jgi:CRP/FNR family transcriptional regulator, cyclic AMP receptor protein
MFKTSSEFARASDEARGALSAALSRRTYSNNEVVYLQEEEAQNLYFVISGHIRLSYVMDDGSAILYAILPPGDSFGELGIFDGGVHCDMAMGIGNAVVGRVLTHLRNYLQQICKSELVASDEEAQRIIISMVHCRDMTEVDAQMDRLLVRIGEVLAARTGDKTEFDRLVNLARARGRTVFASHAKRHNFAAGDEAPRRKFIRS